MDDEPIEIARDRGDPEMEQLLTHTLDFAGISSRSWKRLAALDDFRNRLIRAA
jgi:hypothetical protein